jgi:hypothetical protein
MSIRIGAALRRECSVAVDPPRKFEFRPLAVGTWPCPALPAAGWVAIAARFQVHLLDNQLQQSNSVGEGHALN